MSAEWLLKNNVGKHSPYSGPTNNCEGSPHYGWKKKKDFNKDMEEGPYILLYPDDTELINIPGTQRPFTLKDYKTEIGKH